MFQWECERFINNKNYHNCEYYKLRKKVVTGVTIEAGLSIYEAWSMQF